MGRIAIIPVRSGSKGLKDKNILPIDGKPLMSYTIRAAIESKMFDKVFVSTDSGAYAGIAEQYGADASFLRSEKNSADTAGSWDVVREVIDVFEKKGLHYEEIMLLQATSPLRNAADICKAIQVMEANEALSVMSVTEMDYSPVCADVLPEDRCMDHFAENEYYDLPRQQLPVYYRINGAIYLIKRSELDKDEMFRERAFAYVMPKSRSVDIDDKVDYLLAEAIMKTEREI